MPLEILTVCTGNIVRSPLSEQYLRLQLTGLPVTVASAGTGPREGDRMTAEALEIAAELGIPTAESQAHGARRLTEAVVATPSLILTATRAHRAAVVELDPARLRSTFTLREFARLSVHVSDDEVADAAASADSAAGENAEARLRAVLARILAVRGTVDPPADPLEDDVLDPAGRSWNSYVASMEQLLPATDEVARVLRAALR